jgi:hypothetical protein
MIDLVWTLDEESNRWMLNVTNNTGGEIHDFALVTAGKFMSYPPAWPTGVTKTLKTLVPGVPHPNTSLSYCSWYAEGDDNDENPIEQHLSD